MLSGRLRRWLLHVSTALPVCPLCVQECNRQLAELVAQAADEVIAALPGGCKSHTNKPSHYHITVYMTSQPHTLR